MPEQECGCYTTLWCHQCTRVVTRDHAHTPLKFTVQHVGACAKASELRTENDQMRSAIKAANVKWEKAECDFYLKNQGMEHDLTICFKAYSELRAALKKLVAVCIDLGPTKKICMICGQFVKPGTVLTHADDCELAEAKRLLEGK